MGFKPENKLDVYTNLYKDIKVGDLVKVKHYKISPWGVVINKYNDEEMPWLSVAYLYLDRKIQDIDLYQFEHSVKLIKKEQK